MSISMFGQNYTATSGQVCSANTYKEWQFDDAPYLTSGITMTAEWIYCGPWSGSNSGSLNVDVWQNGTWVDLFNKSDSGNGCSWVTDTDYITATEWNSSIDPVGGFIKFRAVISDSCPGGVGCSNANDPCIIASVNFNYVEIVAPQASANPTSVIVCQNENLLIENLTTGTGLTYAWDFGAGASPATSNTGGNKNVTYLTPGTKTVTLTVTNIVGSSTTSFDIEVNPSPELTVSSDVSLCADAFPVTIEAFGTGDFLWSNELGSTTSVDVDPISSSKYYVSLTNEFDCTSVDSIYVEVLSLPVVDAGADVEVCAGEEITISGIGDSEMEWLEFPGEALDQTFVPVGTSTYHLLASGANGCSNSDEVLVVVHEIPLANAGEDQEICIGESTEITASGGSAYLWEGFVNDDQSQFITPEETTEYFVNVSNEFGCSSDDTVIIIVNPVPIANVTENTEICFGESVTISASGGLSYMWDQDLGAGAEHTVSPTENTVYSVIVSNEYDCTAIGEVSIIVHPETVLSVVGLDTEPYCIQDDNAYNMLGNPSGGVFSGLGVSGGQFFPANAGVGPVEIVYSFTDEFGCVFTNSTIVTVEICENVFELEKSFNIFPNPVNDILSINFDLSQTQNIAIELTDLTGKLLIENQKQNINGKSTLQIDLSTFESGVYVLNINFDGVVVSNKIVKE